jgi:hypothetical protein
MMAVSETGCVYGKKCVDGYISGRVPDNLV